MDADKRHLARGTTVNVAGLVFRNISPVLVVLMARAFPQDVFGIFVSVQLFVLTASRVVVFGLDKGLTWWLPANRREGRSPHDGLTEVMRRTHSTALIVVAVGTAIIAAGALDGLSAFDPVSPTFLILCLATLVPYMSLHCWAAAFDGIRRPEYNLLINQFLATSVGPLISLSLFALGVGDIALAIGYFVSHSMGAAVLWWLSRRHFPRLEVWKRSTVPPALMAYSVPIGLSQAIGNVALRVDLWMLLLLASPEDAAIYSVMMMLTNGVRGIRQGYDPLIVPIVSGMQVERRRRELPGAFSYAVNMVTSIQIIVAVVVLFFPAEILGIAGRNYAVRPEALSILLVSNLVNGLLALTGGVLQGLGRSRAFLLFNVLALGLNITFNAVLIPPMGMVGAALSTAMAYLIQCIGMVVYQHRLTRIQLYQPHLSINAAVIVVFAVVAIGFQDVLLSLTTVHRAPWFGAVALMLGTLYLVKRRTYAIAGATRSKPPTSDAESSSSEGSGRADPQRVTTREKRA